MDENKISTLYTLVINDKEVSMEDKKVLLDEIRKLKPASENRWNFRYIIWALAIVALVSPLTVLVHGYTASFPEGVLALSSTAVGALAAFITSGLKK